MTLKELNNLRGIESEISMILKNIDELRTQAEHITPNITTYTHTNPKTGQKETCVLPNVGGAGSAHSRTEIFTELISEVAGNVGGGNTSDSVRMQVMRFLENQ